MELKERISKLIDQYLEGAITGEELHMAIGNAIYEFEQAIPNRKD